MPRGMLFVGREYPEAKKDRKDDIDRNDNDDDDANYCFNSLGGMTHPNPASGLGLLVKYFLAHDGMCSLALEFGKMPENEVNERIFAADGEAFNHKNRQFLVQQKRRFFL